MVAAFWWEVGPLLKKRRRVERLGRGYFRFSLRGEPIVLAIAGAGVTNAYLAARGLVEKYPLRGLLSVGFAAGLVESLAPGELVLADRLIEERTMELFACRANLLPITSGRHGSLLCVPNVLNTGEEKRLLWERWGTVAADMESAGVARAAAEAELPFGAVKSITDPSTQSIAIDFQHCQSEHGGLSSWKIVREGLTSPRRLQDLWRLAGNSRRAAGSLALALGSV